MQTNTTIVRPDDLAEDFGVSPRTLKRWQATLGFPPARKLGKRATGYVRSEVDRWIESRPTVTPAPSDYGRS